MFWQATRACSLAAVGDATLMLGSFWGVTAVARSRMWVLAPSAIQVAGSTVTGIARIVIEERVALEQLPFWAYAAHMPRLPLLQYMILSPLVGWFAKCQLR